MANGIAEALGLGTTLLVGIAAAPLLAEATALTEVLVAGLLAVLFGTVLEGVVVGLAQGHVLRSRAPEITLRAWTTATAVGAGLAWTVGMVPSSIMALAEPGGPDVSAAEPTPLLQLLLATGLGLATGPILGVAQWVVLRRRFRGAGSWLWANALAWAVGMPLIFAGMDRVPWDGGWLARSSAIVLVCLVAGAVVGAVHGSVLVRITGGRPASD